MQLGSVVYVGCVNSGFQQMGSWWLARQEAVNNILRILSVEVECATLSASVLWLVQL